MRFLIYVNTYYFAFATLFLIDQSESFDLVGYFKKVVYTVAIIGCALIFILNIYAAIQRRGYLFGLIAPATIIINIAMNGMLFTLFSSEPWETRDTYEVIREGRQIEVSMQIQDIGILGTNTRNVQIRPITPWLIWVKQVEE